MPEALLAGRPVDVGEERLDVLRPVGRLVVEEEGVLPHVHHEHGDEARDVAHLVQSDPVVREPLVDRVLVADRPAHAAHLADADEIRLPDVVAAEGAFGQFVEVRVLLGVGRRRALLHVAEVPLVQDHAVVLEAEAAGQFRVGGHLLLIDLAVREYLGNLGRQRVGVRDIALVELEVHLQSLVGDAVQPAQIELLRRVKLNVCHHILLVIMAATPESEAAAPSRGDAARSCAHTHARPQAFTISFVARLRLGKIIEQ